MRGSTATGYLVNDTGFFESVAAKLSWCVRAFGDPSSFDHIALGRTAVVLALALYVFAIGFSLSAQLVRDRTWVVASRRAVMFAGGSTLLAALCLITSFVKGDYHLKYVHHYSERALPLPFKISGLWAGLDGSILFWSMLVGLLAAIVAFTYRKDENHPVARRMEPNVYVVLSVVQLFFLIVIAFVADPFQTLQESMPAEQFMARFPDGDPTDGAGLNPQLVSYWMQIHPPCLYIGFVIYTVPFAFGMAALITGEQGAFWVQKTRRWMLAGWLFNTCGIILGGLWAYEVLGWGGYWAWDPVENASFLPWFTATAFLHMIMLQERRDMARNWNVILVWLTFISTLVGTWLTRSGVVSSVHAFASGEVGHWFLGFMLLVVVVGAGLIASRFFDFSGRAKVEAFFSRECVFVINNMILVGLALAIFLTTMAPKFTLELFGQATTASIPFYNLVMTPGFIIMLFLTAIGPAMGWVRTSPKTLVRNLGWPALVAIPVAAGIQWSAHAIRAGEDGNLPFAAQLYPTAFVNYAGALIFCALSWEVIRTIRSRVQRRDEGLVAAFAMLLTKNNRRYGGYIVHIGLATLAIGIVNSSMFKVKHEKVRLSPADVEGSDMPSRHRLGAYELVFETFHAVQPTDDMELPYQSNEATIVVYETDGEARGAEVARLVPEIRLYPTTKFRREPQRVSEPAIHRGLTQDSYVFFQAVEGNIFQFDFHRNPLMGLIWVGWMTMIAGALWAALPMGRRRVGLTN